MNLFFIILARDHRYVSEKIEEIRAFNVPFVVVCGENFNERGVIYREPKGKWDAVNFGSKFVPKETDVVLLNDVDTKIHNFEYAIAKIMDGTELVYCRVKVSKGPQVKFYRMVNPVRKWLHLFACGELMLIRKEVFDKVLPIPPCLAEDSYILFKALELGYHANFCKETFVTTERTSNFEEEVSYKARTTLGIYQALDNANPPIVIRMIYKVLPFVSFLFTFFGEEGKAWSKGIQKAIISYKQGVKLTKF
jgi:hypothetical protein